MPLTRAHTSVGVGLVGRGVIVILRRINWHSPSPVLAGYDSAQWEFCGGMRSTEYHFNNISFSCNLYETYSDRFAHLLIVDEFFLPDANATRYKNSTEEQWKTHVSHPVCICGNHAWQSRRRAAYWNDQLYSPSGRKIQRNEYKQ